MKKKIILLLSLSACFGLFSSCDSDDTNNPNNNTISPEIPANAELLIHIASGKQKDTRYVSTNHGMATATQVDIEIDKDEPLIVTYVFAASYKDWSINGIFADIEDKKFNFESNKLSITDNVNKIRFESIERKGEWDILEISKIKDLPTKGQKMIKCKITFKGKFNIIKDNVILEENVEVNGTLSFKS